MSQHFLVTEAFVPSIPVWVARMTFNSALIDWLGSWFWLNEYTVLSGIHIKLLLVIYMAAWLLPLTLLFMYKILCLCENAALNTSFNQSHSCHFPEALYHQYIKSTQYIYIHEETLNLSDHDTSMIEHIKEALGECFLWPAHFLLMRWWWTGSDGDMVSTFHEVWRGFEIYKF